MKILEILEAQSNQFSRASVTMLHEFVIGNAISYLSIHFHPDLIQTKVAEVDTILKITLKQVLSKYTGQDIRQAKELLIGDISEILYDEMIFNKVFHKIDDTYKRELDVLGNEQAKLVEARDHDLQLLKEEREGRLKSSGN